jgi:hypothetical protein|tara:strand:+ start:8726 stop:9553 length:828 start_codon:yes stop_codon:yes gene_type:complete
MIFILVFFIFYQKKNMEQQMDLKIKFIEEKNILRDELDDLIDEHDELLDEYGDLNNQLYQKDSLIQQQIVEIRNLIRNKNDLNKARVKINNLKRISQNYIKDIDSLFYVTERLSLEKDSVIKVNKNINWKNYKLNKTNIQLSEKVNKGSTLKIKEISVEPFRYRSTGKEVSTRSAEKTQTLRACFYISANLIADAGEKEILIQYIDPKNKILSGSDTIINEQQIIFSAKADVQYSNQQSFVCIDWQRYILLVEGDYRLKIFIDNIFTAESQFHLR